MIFSAGGPVSDTNCNRVPAPGFLFREAVGPAEVPVTLRKPSHLILEDGGGWLPDQHRIQLRDCPAAKAAGYPVPECSMNSLSSDIKSGNDLIPSPPQFEPFDVLCVHVFLSHTCHSGTDFVLTLFWFMMLYFDYFTIIANVNKHLWDSQIITCDSWTLQLCDTDAFLAFSKDTVC